MTQFKELQTARRMVNWVNETLESDLEQIEELCTGAAYCQLMDMLFSNSVSLSCVMFSTNQMRHFKKNFYLLSKAFEFVQIPVNLPIEQLIRGDFQANLKFAQRFHRFYCGIVEERGGFGNKSYRPNMARGGSKLRLNNPEVMVCSRSAQTQYAKIPWSGNENDVDKLLEERVYYMKLLGEIEQHVEKHKKRAIESVRIQAMLYKTPQPYF